MKIAELAIALASLLSIGIGLWLERPSLAFIGVGSLVLAMTVAGRVLSLKQRKVEADD